MNCINIYIFHFHGPKKMLEIYVGLHVCMKWREMRFLKRWRIRKLEEKLKINCHTKHNKQLCSINLLYHSAQVRPYYLHNMANYPEFTSEQSPNDNRRSTAHQFGFELVWLAIKLNNVVLQNLIYVVSSPCFKLGMLECQTRGMSFNFFSSLVNSTVTHIPYQLHTSIA